MASRKLKMRVDFLSEIIKFISFCETRIRYSQSPIREIFKDYDNSSLIFGMLKNCNDKINNNIPFEQSWKLSINEISNEFGLSNQDKCLIKDFGINLGSSDIKGQISNCKLSSKLIKNILSEAYEIKNTKSKLYLTLGSSLGLIVVLILC